MRDVVNRGQRMSVYAADHADLFPDLFVQMVAIGERSGNLPETLLYMSDFYEREIDDFAKNLSNLAEPILMICMGLFVGLIAISIITPIYGITQNLHN